MSLNTKLAQAAIEKRAAIKADFDARGRAALSGCSHRELMACLGDTLAELLPMHKRSMQGALHAGDDKEAARIWAKANLIGKELVERDSNGREWGDEMER